MMPEGSGARSTGPACAINGAVIAEHYGIYRIARERRAHFQ